VNFSVEDGSPLHRFLFAAVSDLRAELGVNGRHVPGLEELYRDLSPTAVTLRKRHRRELSRLRTARWRARQRARREADQPSRVA